MARKSLKVEGRRGLSFFAFVDQPDGEGDSEFCFLQPQGVGVKGLVGQLHDLRKFLWRWHGRAQSGERVRIRVDISE